jgi:phage/plasmid primase-like uncharacterized protein
MSDRRNLPSADDVRRAATNRWREVLPLCGVSPRLLDNRHHPCPGCGGSDRFRFDDREGRGTFICSQGGGEPIAGDGFTLLQHVHGCGFASAAEMVATSLGLQHGRLPDPAPAPQAEKPRQERRSRLTATEYQRWLAAQPITENDPAGRYLYGRGCALPQADGDLRWSAKVRHWPSGYEGPALMALVTDYRTCEPVTLHFTWIKPDGSGKADVDPNRLTLPGYTNVGVCRLWPDAEVTMGLAVAEGLESALTVARGFQPVWATLNAGNLAKLPHLPGIEALTVVADADDAGTKAATACANRWCEAGAEVRVWRAQQEGADPNDVWRAA